MNGRAYPPAPHTFALQIPWTPGAPEQLSVWPLREPPLNGSVIYTRFFSDLARGRTAV